MTTPAAQQQAYQVLGSTRALRGQKSSRRTGHW